MKTSRATSGSLEKEILACADAILTEFTPREIERSETTGTSSAMKGDFTCRVTFASGDCVAITPTFKKDGSWDSKSTEQRYRFTIPDHLNSVLTAYPSVSDYFVALIKKRKTALPKILLGDGTMRSLPRNQQTKDFDRIPLGKLEALRHPPNMPEIEAFVRRRVFLSLLRVCAETDPALFFDNKELVKTLMLNPDSPKSMFYRAIGIEPCILQSTVGLKVLADLSFWNRDNAKHLAIALKPKSGITRTIEARSHGSLIKEALLILLSADKRVSSITDSQLIALLQRHRLIAGPMDIENFKKIRKQVFLKNKKREKMGLPRLPVQK